MTKRHSRFDETGKAKMARDNPTPHERVIVKCERAPVDGPLTWRIFSKGGSGLEIRTGQAMPKPLRRLDAPSPMFYFAFVRNGRWRFIEPAPSQDW